MHELFFVAVGFLLGVAAQAYLSIRYHRVPGLTMSERLATTDTREWQDRFHGAGTFSDEFEPTLVSAYVLPESWDEDTLVSGGGR